MGSQSISPRPMSICYLLSVRLFPPPGNPVSRLTGDFWLESLWQYWLSLYIRQSSVCFQILLFRCFFAFFLLFLSRVLGSLQTILLCIIRDLTGAESVAVAVNISDKGQVTRDTQHLTCYTQHLTPDA